MKKTIGIILLCALLCSSLAACGSSGTNGGTNGTNGTTSAGEATTSAQTAAETLYSANIPQGTDFGGREFGVYTYDSSNATWSDVDFSATEETGDTLNDAVYRRMINVEDNLNVDIVAYPIATGCGDYAKLKNSVSAGDSIYDIAFLNPRSSAVAGQGGYLIDLKRMQTLQLDAPWWDQNCVSEASIDGKLFSVTGDIGTMYKKSIGVLLFNKQMINNYGLENPYQLVTDMTWTIDKFTEMSRAVSEDLNGDMVYDLSDKYGLLYYCDLIGLGMIGGGVNFTTKNAEDIPELTFYNDTTLSIWETYTKLLYDNTISLSWSKLGKSNDDIIAMFRNGQGLFNFNEFHSIENMRKMDTDFGILPIPLYSENQDSYHHTINPYVAAMLTVPADNDDLEFTASVMDALGAESKNILTPAYNEVYLKAKGTRDNDSEAVLDIVFGTLKYDLGYLYGWGNLGHFTLAMVDKYSPDLSSEYAKIEAKAQSEMQKAIDAIDKLG